MQEIRARARGHGRERKHPSPFTQTPGRNSDVTCTDRSPFRMPFEICRILSCRSGTTETFALWPHSSNSGSHRSYYFGTCMRSRFQLMTMTVPRSGTGKVETLRKRGKMRVYYRFKAMCGCHNGHLRIPNLAIRSSATSHTSTTESPNPTADLRREGEKAAPIRMDRNHNRHG